MEILEGNIVDVVQKEIYYGQLKTDKGKISGTIKLSSIIEGCCYILPGLVDAHVHIESSMLAPSGFAKMVVPHGTVATVSDPHEIANVLGVDGVDFMINNASLSGFKFFFGLPSCVPATEFESSGAKITANNVESLINRSDIYYLAEMMDFPGVIYKDSEVLRKIVAANNAGKPIDGHAPGLTGDLLSGYINTGITTDHECFSIEEAIEKIEKGMLIQIRDGSAAKNFEALCNLIDLYPDKIMLCSDDLHPDNLLKGHINLLIKRAIGKGLNIFNILRAATYNPIKHYKIDVGLLQQGDSADLIVVDNLNNFKIEKTYISGRLVYDGTKILLPNVNISPANKFNRVTFVTFNDLQIVDKGLPVKVIEVLDGELITRTIVVLPKVESGYIISDLDSDILKIVVVNRYDNTSIPVVGFIRNFGLKYGAIASSIAHDSHNIIAVGATDDDLVNAINKLIENKGGIVAVSKNKVLELKLNIAGLMSDEDGYIVAKKYEELDFKAKEFGSKLRAPFMTLSFMALLVIPELKIGDKGLFDGAKFQFTSLWEEQS